MRKVITVIALLASGCKFGAVASESKQYEGSGANICGELQADTERAAQGGDQNFVASVHHRNLVTAESSCIQGRLMACNLKLSNLSNATNTQTTSTSPETQSVSGTNDPLVADSGVQPFADPYADPNVDQTASSTEPTSEPTFALQDLSADASGGACGSCPAEDQASIQALIDTYTAAANAVQSCQLDETKLATRAATDAGTEEEVCTAEDFLGEEQGTEGFNLGDYNTTSKQFSTQTLSTSVSLFNGKASVTLSSTEEVVYTANFTANSREELQASGACIKKKKPVGNEFQEAYISVDGTVDCAFKATGTLAAKGGVGASAGVGIFLAKVEAAFVQENGGSNSWEIPGDPIAPIPFAKGQSILKVEQVCRDYLTAHADLVKKATDQARLVMETKANAAARLVNLGNANVAELKSCISDADCKNGVTYHIGRCVAGKDLNMCEYFAREGDRCKTGPGARACDPKGGLYCKQTQAGGIFQSAEYRCKRVGE